MINFEQVYDKIKVSYYNEKGGINIDNISIPNSQRFNWKHCEENHPQRERGYLSHLGLPVMKDYSKRWLNKYRLIEFLNNLSPETRNKFFSMNPPKKWFMDIETEIIDGLPNAYVANEKVLTNAFCNEDGQMFIQGMIKLDAEQKERLNKRINDYFADTKNYKDGKRTIFKTFTTHYKYYESEAMMMADLFYNYIPKMPLIAGWNFLKFDWNFLVNRGKKLGIDTNKASYTNTTFTLTLKDKYDKTKRDKIEMPMHRGIIDYMFLYEKWDSSVKLKSSHSLDGASSDVLGIQKVKYTGALKDLYASDFETFIFYNAVDTILVQLIDEKLGTFNTMLTLANEGGVALQDAAFASVIMESLFSNEFYTGEKKVFVQQTALEDTESYSGGYVVEPKKGKFSYVQIWDYESMFPSLMMMLNTGIDAFLGKTNDGGKTFIDKQGQVQNVNPEIHIWTASGVVYDKTKDSVMRKVINKLFDKRIYAKKAGDIIDEEMKELEQMLKSVS